VVIVGFAFRVGFGPKLARNQAEVHALNLSG
jgi:hypothetical protein